jgi:lipoate-protein ligase B
MGMGETRQAPRTLISRLGLVPYEQAITLEEGLCKLRYEGDLPDIVLIMEHPPTVTLGRFGKLENVLLSGEEMVRRGITLAHSKRGGDVTFHTYGQLVLHAVIDLRRRESPLRGFITDLEEVGLRLLASYGVVAERWSEHPGLWVAGRQVGAIGLHMSRGISSHGLALNVDPDLASFGVINLCGLPGCEATSIARELGHSVDMKQATRRFAATFAAVFRLKLTPVAPVALAKWVAEAATPEIVYKISERDNLS